MRSSFFRALAVMPPAALLLVSAVTADPGLSARWEPLDSLVNNPPARWGHMALHDALRDRMIVYGGAASPRDVWTMTLGQPTIWSVLPTEGPGPPPRRLAVCVIDTDRDRLIVFGGFDTIRGRTDVWALSLSEPHAWQQIVPAGPAVTSTGNTVGVYDPVGDRLVVFDAVDSAGVETGLQWQLSLAGTPAWSALPVTSAQPARRRGAAAIYDPLRHRMVLFQGWNGDHPTSGTVWALDLASPVGWTQLADATTTGQREHYSAALDAARDRVLIFGGELATGFYFGDTEAFDLATRVWADLGLTTTGRGHHAAIFDPLRDRMIVHGGAHGGAQYLVPPSVQALEFTPLAWTTLGPPVPGDRPQPRAGHAVIYDPVRECLWMTGGGTWRFDLAEPRWRAVASPDPSLSSGGVIRDALRDRLIATIGGRPVAGTPVWQFDPATETWTTLQPIGGPSYGRHSSGYAYDPLRDRLLMFGGLAPGTSSDLRLNDLWALNFSPQLEWVELHPGGTAPTPRYKAGMVYDPVRDRLLLHGGIGTSASAHSSGELWELTLSGTFSWNQLAPGNPPDPRHSHTMLYDASRDLLLMLGGLKNQFRPGEGYEEDIWALPLGGPVLTWEQLPQSDERPLRRSSAAGAIDPARDQIIWFGGSDGAEALDDTWRLAFDDLVPVLVSLVEQSVGPGSVRLRWRLGSLPAGAIEVQQRVGGGDWTSVAEARPDAALDIRFEASGLAPGRYGFRLWLPEESSAIGGVDVEVPAVAFELRLAGASPAEGPVEFEIRLPDASPGRFEVFDVAGRRLSSRTVTAGGDGRVLVRLTADEMKAPGLCFARVLHREQERRVRFVRLQ